MKKKMRSILVMLLICLLYVPVNVLAAENSVRATNRYQENVAVASALTAYGGEVEFTGSNLMVSAKMSNITNTPSSLTVVLQKKGLFNIWNDTNNKVTIPISTNVQDVFYGIKISPNTPYRFKYILNGGAGSYVEVSLGDSSY